MCPDALCNVVPSLTLLRVSNLNLDDDISKFCSCQLGLHPGAANSNALRCLVYRLWLGYKIMWKDAL